MALLKKPGGSLLIAGLLLLFVARPIVDAIPAIGGFLAGIASLVGLIGTVGGGYLLFRSINGKGR